MHRRVVLSGVLLLAGIPMFASDAAPLGALLVAVAVAQLALPWLLRRRSVNR